MSGANSSFQSPEVPDFAADRAIVARLPVTLRPSVNGQLAEWEFLFPRERDRVRQFLDGVGALSPAQLASLTAPLRELEVRMGVDRWEFAQQADTMENASLLARSEHYGEWREQVSHFYSAVAAQSIHRSGPEPLQPRLIVAILPAELPTDPAKVWKRWPAEALGAAMVGDPARYAAALAADPRIAEFTAQEPSDRWLVDASAQLEAFNGAHPAMALSWPNLKQLTDHVLERVNTVPRNISATDQILATVRAENTTAFEPEHLRGQPRLRRFLIDLYLSGNGALIYPNSFVQWAASEALRRARPRVLMARFGMRQRPKPFTGIAIFENQERLSTLPGVDDPHGSAIDAAILARYILLGASRFPEARSTAFVGLAESAGSIRKPCHIRQIIAIRASTNGLS